MNQTNNVNNKSENQDNHKISTNQSDQKISDPSDDEMILCDDFYYFKCPHCSEVHKNELNCKIFKIIQSNSKLFEAIKSNSILQSAQKSLVQKLPKKSSGFLCRYPKNTQQNKNIILCCIFSDIFIIWIYDNNNFPEK